MQTQRVCNSFYGRIADEILRQAQDDGIGYSSRSKDLKGVQESLPALSQGFSRLRSNFLAEKFVL